jgi:murein L,D-transpeptidase YafK
LKKQIVILMILASFIAVCHRPSNGISTENVKVDRVILKKGERNLILTTGGTVLKSYKVALGGNPIGSKKQEGDNKTPEGSYIIDRHEPNSSFHLSLHISYPSTADRKQALRSGVRPGGNIMIHGIKNGLGWVGPLHRMSDWTKGCIAVTNQEIEEIYALVPDGTPIDLQP